MKNNSQTLTYTARSQTNPEKIATFTLQEKQVTVELGTALMERVENLIDVFQSDESLHIGNVLEPAATGALHRLLQPIPLADFDASLTGDTLQLTAWLRAVLMDDAGAADWISLGGTNVSVETKGSATA